MKFIDEATITIHSGKGGAGCMAFHREKFVPFGGPSGGDGGRGGSVFMIAKEQTNTLVDFRFKTVFKAEVGEQGKGGNRTGHSGKNLTIEVPVGTVVFDHENGELIHDFSSPDEVFTLAQGGDGGKGNAHYKSSTNQAPRRTTPGFPGETKVLRLELQVLADVGTLGLPNAGKSSLVRTVSKATPKVADYPFTSLYPTLGVVRTDIVHSFVMADLPGLVSGASSGSGLGIRFLKHLSRTRLLLHIIDVEPLDGRDIVDSYKTIENELKTFNEILYEKERWIVFSKCDLLDEKSLKQKITNFKKQTKFKGKIYTISTITRSGIETLIKDISIYILENYQKPEEELKQQIILAEQIHMTLDADRVRRLQERDARRAGSDEDDDFDDGVEVIYK